MAEWPTANDYTIAVQTPHLSFKDSVLQRALVEKHSVTRMPKVWTGNFAQVYELRHSGQRWAVKCFTRSASDAQHRYAEISRALQAARLPYFVEFLFLPDEILVNGRRFPVVRMAWVEGVALDRWIEQHLYQPDEISRLAADLFRMVSELERHGIAHGDLQHGNILLQGGSVKLVDYDGMFVPALAGHRASELGLPSYQHPRREANLFGSQLDRFSLLVIGTALSALAAEPKLWYEFGTGDNLLFRRTDFEEPRTSAFFARLRQLGDRRVASLADVLADACLADLSDVPLPTIDFSTVPVVRRQPWWVTAGSSEVSSSTDAEALPLRSWREFTALITSLRRRGSLIAATAVLLGIWLVAMSRAVEPDLATAMSGIVGCAYLTERYVRYRGIPAFRRRVELRQALAQQRARLTDLPGEKANAQSEVTRIGQDEAREKGEVLRRVQDEAFRRQLQAIDIAKIGQIKGMPGSVISNFRALGIDTLADMHQRNIHAVRGVGPKRYSQIRALVSQIEAEARARVPGSLPYQEEARITAKYRPLRQAAIDRLSAIDREIASATAEVAQCERELSLLHVPTFAHFLRGHA